jgi:addiction module HigA family antidote
MATKTQRHPDLAPASPGELLREIVIPATGLTKTAVAQALGISRTTLYAVLNDDQPVTPELAMRFGKFFKDGPEVWLRMQNARDVWRLSREMRKSLAKIEPINEAV